MQSADFADTNEVKILLTSLKQHLELLHEHAVHEDNIIFPELANNEPEMIEVLNNEHKMLEEKLNKIKSKHVKEIRGKGLFIGVELKPEAKGARRFCQALKNKGILCKETHENVIRFAPPLIITKEDIDWALPKIREVLLAD